MASIKEITVCMGIGLNQLFPEYTRIKILPIIKILQEKNTIITDWLEVNGDCEIDATVEANLEKTTKSKKNG
jgi:hypothetical protein